MTASDATAARGAHHARGSPAALTRYFLRLGSLGFGGPIALAGAMRRDLVEARGWITEDEYREGLALAQIAPGPLAAQLAIYLGWVRGGTSGATLAGLAFVAPSFVLVLALSAIYVRFGGLSWMQGAFYGIGAAVIAIIARSAVRLATVTQRRDLLLWGIFAVNAVVTAAAETELVWLILASGVAVLVARTRLRARPTMLAVFLPPWLLAGAAGTTSPDVLLDLLWFFAKAGAIVFGSGLAIIPFLYGGVVERFHWLSERQFLDAIAVSMITPGPVVITVAFIGYLRAGTLGALAAAVGVFLPVYLAVVLTARHFHRVAHSPRVAAVVDGVTAAATGAIAGAAFVLGKRAIVDITTLVIALAAFASHYAPRRVPEPLIVLGAAIVGVALTRGGV